MMVMDGWMVVDGDGMAVVVTSVPAVSVTAGGCT